MADATQKVSPKVIAGLLTGLAIAAIGGIIAAVTPDTFASFGAWGPIVYSLVTVGGAQLAAWLKRDPLRSNPEVPASPVPEASEQGAIDFRPEQPTAAPVPEQVINS